jgi:hypothetical protein
LFTTFFSTNFQRFLLFFFEVGYTIKNAILCL